MLLAMNFPQKDVLEAVESHLYTVFTSRFPFGENRSGDNREPHDDRYTYNVYQSLADYICEIYTGSRPEEVPIFDILAERFGYNLENLTPEMYYEYNQIAVEWLRPAWEGFYNRYFREIDRLIGDHVGGGATITEAYFCFTGTRHPHSLCQLVFDVGTAEAVEPTFHPGVYQRVEVDQPHGAGGQVYLVDDNGSRHPHRTFASGDRVPCTLEFSNPEESLL